MNNFWRAILILVGIILLLPGICSVLFVASDIGGILYSIYHMEADIFLLVVLWIVCVAVAAGGVLLIRKAVREWGE